MNKSREEQLQEDKQNEEIKLTEEAIIYLQEHDRVLGKDFSVDKAIAYANLVAANLEKNRILDHKNYPFFSFTGDNYCDGSCAGWDGVSYRCDCGNRRVIWDTTSDHSFKNPAIYATSF